MRRYDTANPRTSPAPPSQRPRSGAAAQTSGVSTATMRRSVGFTGGTPWPDPPTGMRPSARQEADRVVGPLQRRTGDGAGLGGALAQQGCQLAAVADQLAVALLDRGEQLDDGVGGV